MLTRHSMIAAICVLIPMIALAQLGPAGVPGAPGLYTPPQVKTTERTESQKAPTPTLEASKTAQATLGKPLPKPLAPNVSTASIIDCTKASDPARCEHYQRARSACANAEGESYYQCLREMLVLPTPIAQVN